MFTGAELERMSWLLATGWCVVAIVAGQAHLSRKHRKEEPLGISQTPVGLEAQPQVQLANRQQPQKPKGARR